MEILAWHWFHRTEEALESTKSYFNKWCDSCLKNQAIFITGFSPKSLPPLQFPLIFSTDNLCTSPPQWLMLSTSRKLQFPVEHIQWCAPAALHVPRNAALSPSEPVAGAGERLLRVEGAVGKRSKFPEEPDERLSSGEQRTRWSVRLFVCVSVCLRWR